MEPMTARNGCLGWVINVIVKMPQKKIMMEMRLVVILGHQLAIKADRMLMTINDSNYPVSGSCTIIEQEAKGVCFPCVVSCITVVL